ncbi:hypothetical protein DWB61_09990 [Ancylomarina euxinus]|uniref:Tetratricopeptide repeat protein n=1 Tax=Ancylomarina euxinus TaxID=2283627 RepID=A0A425Y1L4_9BACT|nr:hypothetical protein [Ancylomarina euxinus]MCZ4693742.1 hypothetical protein [Ancylomarina euxinus]MUP15178.1 hypothetical protein [Ancylomarina euxinus]RRG21600.1 hypothetical protein DWB61_09990 [Ancylomarina euxinus]
MKKIVLFILLISSQILISSAQNSYEKGMSQALQLWGNTKPMEAIALFERIASNEKENWLPNYYIGLISATQVLSGREKEQASALLEQAQESLNKAKKQSSNNSELFCLQALINTAWVTLDQMNNGQKLSASIMKDYRTAIQLDTNNPRPLYLLAEYQINMAKLFGQDTKPFYEMIQSSLKKFDNFKAPSAFYPRWGRNRAEQLLIGKNAN